MIDKKAQIVLDAIKSRRSIRKYKSTPVPDELIDKIVEAGTYAASGKSMQPWKVVVVKDEETKNRIRIANAKVLGKDENADPFYGAPVYIIVLAERANPNHLYDGTLMLGNMMLAAHALGLGSCWINRARQEFDQDEWKEWLKSIGIEGEYEGIGHLSLGYPDGEPHPAKERKECVVKV